MSVSYIKHINSDENNRIEFILVNFDYFDGNDIISKLMQEDYGMKADDKIDGIHYSIIKLHDYKISYNLVWHEDVGNYIYSSEQSDSAIDVLEKRLSAVLEKLNILLVV